MATTNIHNARHLDRTPVCESDIKMGLKLTFPNSTGGVCTAQCVELNEVKATFKSIDKDWPYTFSIEFNQPDFSLADFAALREALREYDASFSFPSDAQRALSYRADELGYARVMSYTQAHWTELGIETFRALELSSQA